LVISALKSEALGKKGEIIPSANSKEERPRRLVLASISLHPFLLRIKGNSPTGSIAAL